MSSHHVHVFLHQGPIQSAKSGLSWFHPLYQQKSMKFDKNGCFTIKLVLNLNWSIDLTSNSDRRLTFHSRSIWYAHSLTPALLCACSRLSRMSSSRPSVRPRARHLIAFIWAEICHRSLSESFRLLAICFSVDIVFTWQENCEGAEY